MEPSTRYARSGDVNIAYQVVGEGSFDLVINWGWASHLEAAWDDPEISDFLSRLASFSRLIIFDKRGVGMSDRVPDSALPGLEQRMDDIRAVMDAAGSERAALLGISEGGVLCILFAATYPTRTSALILFGSWSTWVRDADYPWAPTLEQHEQAMRMLMAQDPSEPFNLERFAPSKLNDLEFKKRFARYGRLSASPGAALALYRMNVQMDVRDILESVHVPTLLLHRRGDRLIYPQASRFMAERIKGAKYVELEGADHVAWVGDRGSLVGEVEEFLTGARHEVESDRVLVTVLFTDIVNSTLRAAEVGDRAWKILLTAHDNAVDRYVARFNGQVVKSTGDGTLATFDGPARAVRCAMGIVRELHDSGLPIRAGLHTGEIKVMEHDIAGIAVHIAARVSALADADEVLVSSTVRDLTAGSGISFEDRGTHPLKGVTEPWRIFAVTSV